MAWLPFVQSPRILGKTRMNIGPQFEELPTNDLQPWLSAEMDWEVFQYECETMYITMGYDPWNMEQIAGSDMSQDGNHISLSMMDPLEHMSGSETKPQQSLLLSRQLNASPSTSSATDKFLLQSPLSVSSIRSTTASPNTNIVGSTSPPLSVSHYTCHYCNKSFEKKHLLNCHERLHTKPISCPAPNCMHRVAKERDMKRHLMAQHPALSLTQKLLAASNFNCSVTGCRFSQEGFKRKDHLKRHVRKVHGK